VNRDEMLGLFEAHREAEAARNIDRILETFVPDPFLETTALGLRSEGRDAVRTAYEMQFFSAFPDLAPDDEGMAIGDETVVVWGTLRGTSVGEWLGVPPGGGTFAVPLPTWSRSEMGSWRARLSTSISRHFANKPAFRWKKCARRQRLGDPSVDRARKWARSRRRRHSQTQAVDRSICSLWLKEIRCDLRSRAAP
jgi:SnoaL-like domain